MRSEHDSKVAGHFGRERTMELVTRNFYWPNMDTELWKYCKNVIFVREQRALNMLNMGCYTGWRWPANHGRISAQIV